MMQRRVLVPCLFDSSLKFHNIGLELFIFAGFLFNTFFQLLNDLFQLINLIIELFFLFLEAFLDSLELLLIDGCSIDLVVVVGDVLSHFLEAFDQLLDAVSPSLELFLKSVDYFAFFINKITILIELRLKDFLLVVFVALQLFDFCNFFTDYVP